ncbi:MAG: hypothetical protein JSS95_15035 [Acidobacteria bacterium]|nr:hypothetical protein [Acidobacteriota bacterium]
MRVKWTLPGRTVSIALFLMAVAVLFRAPSAQAAAGNTALKIYEVAGAGGLAGATYRQDTIILFNPTQATISCTTCSIQTHSGTSNTASWTVYKLPSLSIPAGGYFMISASSPTLSTVGSLSPIPYDYRLKTIEGTVVDGTSGDNILSSTVGVIALAGTQTALTASSNSLCGTGSQLLDVVGYGSDFATGTTASTPSSCYAGSGEAFYDGSAAVGRQLGATRKNKCIDTFDNATDFVNVPLTFFNSSSAPSPCPTGTQLSAVVSATPTNPGVLESVTFKAVVTKATQPASSGVSAYLNFDSPYFSAAALQMYDDGTHGDTTAGDGTYTVTTTVPTSTVAGYTYPANVTVRDAVGNAYIGTTRLTVPQGTIAMTTTSNTTASIASGGVLTFPITITGQHGYSGVLNITCTGSPNTNSLGLPISTQCVSTPPEVTISTNGTATISLAVAMGTTHSAGIVPRSLPFAFIGIVSIGVLTVGVWRRKHLPSAVLTALVLLLALNTTACGKNAGLGNTGAAPGTYTYLVTATDSNVSTVTNSITLTITVN